MTLGVVPWLEPVTSPAGTVIAVALLVALIAGVVWAVRGRSLLAAIVLFASLAIALLAAALSAAHVPDKLFTGEAPSDTDAAWKAAQTIVLSLGFVGIVITGVVAYHRQRIAQQQTEQDRDRLGLDRRTRQHERFAKGSEMMAADAPEMRIAGLNVIAALGAEVAADDELRQTCINLICAYLRKNSPADQGGPVHTRRTARSQRAQDLQSITRYRAVTEEACRLLPTLFGTAHPTPSAHRRFYRHPTITPPVTLDLDLRNTTLQDINFTNRVIGTARFDGATFTGTALFGKATFTGNAGFDGATFTSDAWFDRATFTRTAELRKATFTSTAWFIKATFTSTAWFDGATFTSDAWFDGATFTSPAQFLRATFLGKARFDGTTFTSDAWLGRSIFTGDAWFGKATFTGDYTWFGEATFIGSVVFDGATFTGNAGFGETTFTSTAQFEKARFVRYSGPDHDDLHRAIFAKDPERPFMGALYGPATDEAQQPSKGPPERRT